MASNTDWNKDIPSGTSAIAQGDDEIRSFKSHMQAWWEEEHYGTDGSTTSAGVHKKGSARAYTAAASALSSPTGDNDGKLFFTTDTAQMYIANASTSSWSIFADNIQLSSAQTWTGLNQFDTGPLSASQLTLGPSREYIYFSDSNIASSSSGLAQVYYAVDGHELGTDVPMVRNGIITAVGISVNDNLTAGSITINPGKDRTASSFTVAVDTSTASNPIGTAGHYSYTTYTTSGMTFVAGEWLCCYVAGSAGLTPNNTVDVNKIIIELTHTDS